MAAARAGMGVVLQPCELVREDLEAGRLVELLLDYPVPTRPLHVLYAPDRRMTPKLHSFLDFVVAKFGSDAQRASSPTLDRESRMHDRSAGTRRRFAWTGTVSFSTSSEWST